MSLPDSTASADYRAAMSTVTRPRGPLPARVYWVRRALVLSVVFILVFTVTRVFGGSDDEQPTARQAAGETQPQEGGETTPAAVTDAEDAARAERRAKRRERRKQQQAALAAPDGPCAPSEVVVASTIRSEPAGGPRIAIPLELSTAREACTFTVSRQTVVLKILSGSDQIWTSQQCPRVLGSHDVVVRAAQPATVTVAWNGRRSAPNCARGTAWADIGGYHAISAALGGEPSDRYFELTKPKPEVITKTRKPKQEKKNDTSDRDRRKNQRTGTTPTRELPDGDGAQEP